MFRDRGVEHPESILPFENRHRPDLAVVRRDARTDAQRMGQLTPVQRILADPVPNMLVRGKRKMKKMDFPIVDENLDVANLLVGKFGHAQGVV